MKSISISDSLTHEYQQTFPREPIEQAVERLLRAEIEAAQVAQRKVWEQDLLEKVARIRLESTLATP